MQGARRLHSARGLTGYTRPGGSLATLGPGARLLHSAQGLDSYIPPGGSPATLGPGAHWLHSAQGLTGCTRPGGLPATLGPGVCWLHLARGLEVTLSPWACWLHSVWDWRLHSARGLEAVVGCLRVASASELVQTRNALKLCTGVAPETLITMATRMAPFYSDYLHLLLTGQTVSPEWAEQISPKVLRKAVNPDVGFKAT